jgi:hypothetical protein
VDARADLVDADRVRVPARPTAAPEDESGRPSGIRERETTPAPAGVIDSILLPSRATLRNLRLGETVPRPTGAPVPGDLDLRLSFLLLHVDGRTPIGHIAAAVGRPAADVLASFLELAALGLVELSA